MFKLLILIPFLLGAHEVAEQGLTLSFSLVPTASVEASVQVGDDGHRYAHYVLRAPGVSRSGFVRLPRRGVALASIGSVVLVAGKPQAVATYRDRRQDEPLSALARGK